MKLEMKVEASASDAAARVVAIRKALAELTKSNHTLAHLDSVLTTYIAEVEKILRAHCTVRIVTTLGNGDELAFGKRDGAWCLFLVYDANTEHEKITPLASAPREERVAAFAQGLIEKLILDAPAVIQAALDERLLALKSAEVLLLAMRKEGS